MKQAEIPGLEPLPEASARRRKVKNRARARPADPTILENMVQPHTVLETPIAAGVVDAHERRRRDCPTVTDRHIGATA